MRRGALFSVLVAIALQTSFMIGLLATALPEEDGLPSAHTIDGVPYYRQYTGQSCGYACLEMIFDYYGADIPQQEIIAVEGRLSELPGYIVGFVREAHFSDESTSAGLYHGTYIDGYEERGMGYAAFRYSSETPWLDQLKAIVAQDYPVMVNQFMELGDEWPHWRLVIGYDDDSGEIIVNDPWDRGDTELTENMRIDYDDFVELWKYDADFGLPNTGTIVLPWAVSIEVPSSVSVGSEFTVTAKAKYICPEPFDDSQYTASEVMATISLPTGFDLVEGEVAEQPMGVLSAGDECEASWQAVATESAADGDIIVAFDGIIEGVDAFGSTYEDRIGGTGTETIIVS